MKRKMVVILATLIACLNVCLGFAACDNKTHEHSFDTYVYNNDATCTQDGTETATCSCGETDTRTAQGTAGHNFTVENECSVCGEKWNYTDGFTYFEFGDTYILSLAANIDTATGDIDVASGDIVIPYGYNGKFVTVIGGSAFRKTPITSIVIPDSVTMIETEAFYGCTSLTSVTIGKGVTSIEGVAFRDCTSLASITIPDSVTEIGWGAFENTGYYNDASNWTGEALYLGQYLIRVKDTVSGAYTVRPGTKVIAGGAFEDCTSLTGVSIPDSVTSIGEDAFENAGYYNDETNWTGDALYIGQYLIQVKDTISNAYSIQQGTKVIAGGAFCYCDSLTSVTIPDSVTSIGEYAFDGCTSLTSVVVPDSVTSIGAEAFFNCSSLTSVTIGKDVTSIGKYAFGGCPSLTSIEYKDTVAQWQKIQKGANWDYTCINDFGSFSKGNYTITCTDGTIDQDGNVTMF